MSGDVTSQIQNELSTMSDEQIRAQLALLMEKQRNRAKSYNTPEAKERRKAYYHKVKDTAEWKAARKEQAEKRKAKVDALIALAQERGIDVKALGF